jgi:flagellar biosynthetic protein FliR
MNAAEVVAKLAQQANLSLLIFTLGLLLCRIMPVLVFSPFLGGEVIPTEVKMGVGVTLSLVFIPLVSQRMGAIPISPLPYIALMCKEIFIGMSLAFIINVVFDAGRVAGGLSDTMMGSNNAQLYVPQLGQQVTLYSNLKVQLSVVLFLTLNGHHIVIEALADSFVAIPLDGFPRFSAGIWPFFDLMIRVFSDLLKISLILSAPVVLATFLTDLGMGAINRVTPNFQVFFIAMAIKPLVACIIAALSMYMLVERYQKEFVFMLTALRGAIKMLL